MVGVEKVTERRYIQEAAYKGLDHRLKESLDG